MGDGVLKHHPHVRPGVDMGFGQRLIMSCPGPEQALYVDLDKIWTRTPMILSNPHVQVHVLPPSYGS